MSSEIVVQQEVRCVVRARVDAIQCLVDKICEDLDKMARLPDGPLDAQQFKYPARRVRTHLREAMLLMRAVGVWHAPDNEVAEQIQQELSGGQGPLPCDAED